MGVLSDFNAPYKYEDTTSKYELERGAFLEMYKSTDSLGNILKAPFEMLSNILDLKGITNATFGGINNIVQTSGTNKLNRQNSEQEYELQAQTKDNRMTILLVAAGLGFLMFIFIKKKKNGK